MPKARTWHAGLTATPHLEVPTSSARTRPPACSGRACQPVSQDESSPSHRCCLRTWCALKCRQNRAQGSVDPLHSAWVLKPSCCSLVSTAFSSSAPSLEGCCWREGRRSEAQAAATSAVYRLGRRVPGPQAWRRWRGPARRAARVLPGAVGSVFCDGRTDLGT